MTDSSGRRFRRWRSPRPGAQREEVIRCQQVQERRERPALARARRRACPGPGNWTSAPYWLASPMPARLMKVPPPTPVVLMLALLLMPLVLPALAVRLMLVQLLMFLILPLVLAVFLMLVLRA